MTTDGACAFATLALYPAITYLSVCQAASGTFEIAAASSRRQVMLPCIAAPPFLQQSLVPLASQCQSLLAFNSCLKHPCLQIFLGTLRDIENEMIRERLASATMESLLALTIFREEFSAFFMAMFASLIFVKVRVTHDTGAMQRAPSSWQRYLKCC